MKEFVCPDCGKSFPGETTLSWHWDSAHGAPDVVAGRVASDVGDADRDPDTATVKEMVLQAAQAYGSLDGFVAQVVEPELVKAGLYARKQGLTPRGEAARVDLERRMARVLREMQARRRSWVEKEPRKALLAAVIAVAVGPRRPKEETQLQQIEHEVEEGAAAAVAPRDTDGLTDIWLDWHFFSHFDGYFHAVDSGADEGESEGDGDDGGDGGDGGGGE